MIGPKLHHPTNRSHALRAKFQLLVALYWLGNGSQYHGLADMHGISKSTVCRSVHSVVAAINAVKFHRKVRFPNNMEEVVRNFCSGNAPMCRMFRWNINKH